MSAVIEADGAALVVLLKHHSGIGEEGYENQNERQCGRCSKLVSDCRNKCAENRKAGFIARLSRISPIGGIIKNLNFAPIGGNFRSLTDSLQLLP
jgi:hypothetical protein